MAGRMVNRRAMRERNVRRPRSDADPRRKSGGPNEATDRPRRKRKVRLKAYWVVINQTLTEVATFEYAQQDEARRRAAELTESKRSPHFVRVVKRPLEMPAPTN